MSIEKTSHLNSIQLSDIQNLAACCDYYDPYFEEFSANDEICFFLYYEEDRLVSFLSFLCVPTTTPGNSGDSSNLASSSGSLDNVEAGANAEMEAEITAMTIPQMRRQGLFSLLLSSALEELTSQNISNVYCALPVALQNSSICKGLSHHEYLLTLDSDSYKPAVQGLPNNLRFSYNHTVNTDTDNTDISDTTDNTDISNTTDTTDNTDIPSAYFLYRRKFFSRTKQIGICHLSEETSFTNIWGVEINPTYRGQGYGRILMSQVLSDYFKRSTKPLILHVSSNNTVACNLYFHCGFKIAEQIDYFKI